MGEMEQFWQGYRSEERKRIEGYVPYQKAMAQADYVRAQEIACQILEGAPWTPVSIRRRFRRYGAK